MVPKELVGAVAALLLGLQPFASLVSMVLPPYQSVESGFILTYCVIAVFTAIVVLLAHRLGRRSPKWSNVSYLCLVSIGLLVLALGAFLLLTALFGAVDSSHGGSLMLLLMATLGIALGAMVWLARRTRLALAAPKGASR